MCALPSHLWAFFLGFRDFDWIAAHLSVWEAIGVLAYGLLFAMAESLGIFGGMVLLGFLVAARWGEPRRIALLSALAIISAIWLMIKQVIQSAAVRFWMVSAGLYAGNALYFGAAGLLILSFGIPLYLILKSEKALRALQGLLERLSLLMTLYLVFDVAAVLVVIIRNR
jgi:hypothetical protein